MCNYIENNNQLLEENIRNPYKQPVWLLHIPLVRGHHLHARSKKQCITLLGSEGFPKAINQRKEAQVVSFIMKW